MYEYDERTNNDGGVMNDNFDRLLRAYEHGNLTRRQLLVALAAVAAAPSTQAAEAPIGAVKQLNHVSIFVPDVQKSVRFYQDLLGMPVLTQQSPGVNLNAGAGFVGIYPSPRAGSGSINHFCLGIENFDADATLKRLTDRGVKANIRLRGDTKELYFDDPDNIRVQLQDVKYKGGTGVLGDRDPE
jgi:catechol 2,3-dioxygenase-like lactoylglutathione lyase family enzyme